MLQSNQNLHLIKWLITQREHLCILNWDLSVTGPTKQNRSKEVERIVNELSNMLGENKNAKFGEQEKGQKQKSVEVSILVLGVNRSR